MDRSSQATLQGRGLSSTPLSHNQRCVSQVFCGLYKFVYSSAAQSRFTHFRISPLQNVVHNPSPFSTRLMQCPSTARRKHQKVLKHVISLLGGNCLIKNTHKNMQIHNTNPYNEIPYAQQRVCRF